MTWKTEVRILEQVKEHVIPRAMGGTKIVPACQICNQIKGSLVFKSMADIQDYILDALLKDGSHTIEQTLISTSTSIPSPPPPLPFKYWNPTRTTAKIASPRLPQCAYPRVLELQRSELLRRRLLFCRKIINSPLNKNHPIWIGRPKGSKTSIHHFCKRLDTHLHFLPEHLWNQRLDHKKEKSQCTVHRRCHQRRRP